MAESSTPARGYAPRDPTRTVLYGAVLQHWRPFAAAMDDAGRGLPAHVTREFEAFLGCGIPALGFARVRCVGCALDRVVAFSCKCRGFCPSCGGRRMSQTAANLVDRVFPKVPVRQWVLTVPMRLRYLLARSGSLLRASPDTRRPPRVRCFVRPILSSRYRRWQCRAME